MTGMRIFAARKMAFSGSMCRSHKATPQSWHRGQSVRSNVIIVIVMCHNALPQQAGAR